MVFTENAEWVEEDGGQLIPGEIINIKSGKNVAESNIGTSDYVPAMTWTGWSCPIEIVDNKITVPEELYYDIVLGANYSIDCGKNVCVFGNGNVSETPDTGVSRIYCNSELDLSKLGYPTNNAIKTLILPNGLIKTNNNIVTGILDTLVIPNTVTEIDTFLGDTYYL